MKFSNQFEKIKQRIYLILKEYQKPLLVTDLLKKVLKRLRGTTYNADILRTEMCSTLLRLVLADMVHLHSCPGQYTVELSEKPKVSDLARNQAAQGAWVTSQIHARANLDIFARILISYLDGEHSIEALVEKMMGHFERNELKLHKEGMVVTNQEELKILVKETISNVLKNGAAQGLLVS